MNSAIENLNRLGEHFLNFAWPMLWQSSLLIVLVFAVDLLLARKIRASVRHALWLVVLVKLVLPPTLALPTGAAWWLFPAKPAVNVPAKRPYVVTYENATPLPALAQASVPITVPFAEPPSPKLDGAGWFLLGSCALSAALLVWLLCRWWQLARKVRAASIPENLGEVLQHARSRAGLPSGIRLKLVDGTMSPAVCGLFRPVILLSQTLAEKLTTEQLRAVLLHEAIHIRRKDIWVNCAQALLQVIYWWHPLVWLANARIRYVREEAVDDAVMVALDAEAEIYAPTLLEVARLTLQRPLLSLGLVGILESRSALRQRIERLLAFRTPRKAGLTVASLCGICMFSAVALPMGEGPARVEKDMAAGASPPLRDMTPQAVVPHTNPPAVLMVAEIYELPVDELKKFVTGLHLNPGQAGGDAWWSASPEEFSKLQSDLKNSGQTPLQQSRFQTISGKPGQFFVGHGAYRPVLDCLLMVDGTQVELSAEEEIEDWAADAALTNRFKVNTLLPNQGGMVIRMQDGAFDEVVCLSLEIITNGPAAQFQITRPSQKIMDKMVKIYLRNVSYDGLPLNEVLKQLSGQCKLLDPEHKGIQFLINNHPDVGSFKIRIPSLTEVRLADVLDAIVRGADRPLQYSVKDFAVIFSAKSPTNELMLFTRVFRMNTNVFLVDTTNTLGRSLNLFRSRCTEAGVNWQSPPGKACFGNGLGYVFVKATKSDLDLIEKILDELNQPTPQNQDRSAPADTAYNRALGERRALAQEQDRPPPWEPSFEMDEMFFAQPSNVFSTDAAGKAGDSVRDGKLLYELGKYDQAQKQFEAALALNRDDARAIYYLHLINEERMHREESQTVAAGSQQLFIRTFRVDPNVFFSGLEKADAQGLGAVKQSTNSDARGGGDQPGKRFNPPTPNPSELARSFFATLGVSISNPPGKTVFFNDRLGYLFVKATKSDLDVIERALQVLDQTPPTQVHLKASFIEVPQGDNNQLGIDWYLGQFNLGNQAVAQTGNPGSHTVPIGPANPIRAFPGATTATTVTNLGQPLFLFNSGLSPATGSTTNTKPAILSNPNFQVFLHALQSRTGVQTLGEPEITTISGRPTQMKATTVQSYIGDFPPYHRPYVGDFPPYHNGDPMNEGHDGLDATP